MIEPGPRVFSIPPGIAFLPTLARELVAGRLVPGFELARDPLSLSDATIYLPTRRAARALEEVFLDVLGGEAVLLPRIAPLGDVDEDVLLTGGFGGEASATLPDAVDPLQRRLLLAGLVGSYSDAIHRRRGRAVAAGPSDDPFFLFNCHPAAILHMADELAGIIEGFETEDVPFSALAKLAASEHDTYWEITLEFLRIAGEAWPLWLAENGVLDPAQRRSRLLAAEAMRLAGGSSRGPVIAAGSTGSIPATARLLAAIARLPNGAVVLPGLDIDGAAFPDPEDAHARAFGHPQYGLARLLNTIGIARESVREIGALPHELGLRRHFIGEAMRPSGSTELWPQARRALGDIGPALAGMRLVEAANEREEALAIAYLLRESIEQPGKTAALVTPDRKLAKRVASELQRWSLTVTDSAGRPLLETPQAVLCELVATAAANGLAAADTLALLRHPLIHLGYADTAELAASVDALELGVLRGPAARAGLAGLHAARVAAEDAATRFGARRKLDWRTIEDLVDRLGAALGPLLAIDEAQPLATYAEATLACLDAVLAGRDLGDEDPPPAEESLRERLEAIVLAPDSRLSLRLGDWPATLRALIEDLAAPAQPVGHPRLAILGLLEARLLQFDRLVLGGLAEGTWPPVPSSDPWLNRSFRHSLKLTPPERRIGLSAHDLAQGLGTADVVLVRAQRSGSAPAIPSRFLQRLEAFAGQDAWGAVRARGDALLALVRQIDFAETRERLKPPEARPPRALRPSQLNLTDIEILYRDPYAVYARRVLNLEPLEALGVEPGAADRGRIIHAALALFVRQRIDPTDPAAFDRLCDIGRDTFGPLMNAPDVAVLWWPNFERIARWFIAWEAGRRAGIEQSLTEQQANFAFMRSSGREFTLTGRADRLDRDADGWAIIDFKTGKPPSDPMVLAGFAPQLPLEAMLLLQSRFDEAAVGPVQSLRYVQLFGSGEGGDDHTVNLKGKTPEEVADAALSTLQKVLDRFENESEAYLSRTRPQFAGRFGGPYDHLARVAEWSATGGESGEEGGE